MLLDDCSGSQAVLLQPASCNFSQIKVHLAVHRSGWISQMHHAQHSCFHAPVQSLAYITSHLPSCRGTKRQPPQSNRCRCLTKAQQHMRRTHVCCCQGKLSQHNECWLGQPAATDATQLALLVQGVVHLTTTTSTTESRTALLKPERSTQVAAALLQGMLCAARLNRQWQQCSCFLPQVPKQMHKFNLTTRPHTTHHTVLSLVLTHAQRNVDHDRKAGC
jgi:hypothetical protein